jgi:hypothetical protein
VNHPLGAVVAGRRDHDRRGEHVARDRPAAAVDHAHRDEPGGGRDAAIPGCLPGGDAGDECAVAVVVAARVVRAERGDVDAIGDAVAEVGDVGDAGVHDRDRGHADAARERREPVGPDSQLPDRQLRRSVLLHPAVTCS